MHIEKGLVAWMTLSLLFCRKQLEDHTLSMDERPNVRLKAV